MSGEVLMAWGPFFFEVGKAAYEEFRHKFGARWEKHPIIGRAPAGQYLGPKEERVRLRGTIYPDVTGQDSATQIAEMVKASGNGDVYPLISSDGTISGPFRLEDAERAGSFIGPDGAPQKVTYDFDFAAHDDGAGQIFGLWPA